MQLHVTTWVPEPPNQPKFVFFINHGVAEHSARYEEFAKTLTAIGGKVVAQDHRGHGKTAGIYGLPLGDFGSSSNPMADIVEDCRELILQELGGVKNNTSDAFLPWFIFGHSMGTIITQHALATFKSHPCMQTLKGVILSGPPAIPCLIERIAFKILLRVMILISRGHWLVRKLTFDKYDGLMKKRHPSEVGGKNCWLNTDPLQVERYNTDPLCGQDMSFRFWLSALEHISGSRALDIVVGKETRLLLLGGEDDAATDFGKSLNEVESRFSKVFSSAEKKVWAGARHEILKERSKSEVLDKVLEFVGK